MRKPEILAPAGDLEKLKFALIYGADAVYAAGKNYGLRASAGNLSLKELQEGVNFAHSFDKKIYVAVNIFAHNKDLIDLKEYLLELNRLEIDGIIVSDPGVIRMAEEIIPEMSLHLSTQANMTNWSSAQFWKEIGFNRVVLARELSLNEIREIYNKVNIDLEAFVHGALCVSYSGRCLLSNFMTERGANQGECSHPCRYKYYLMEEKRPGEYMPIEEDERGSYILNSRDLCMLPYLKDLITSGICSFKIEGRMKSVHYVTTVVKAYRKVLDSIYEKEDTEELINKWLLETKKVSHRDYTTGFYFDSPSAKAHNYDTSSYVRNYDFIGIVKGYNKDKKAYEIEQRNRFFIGDEIEFFTPSGYIISHKVEYMENESGDVINNAPHPQQTVYMFLKFKIEPYTILRRKKKR
jgi:putative protease